jgi:hypothetical protein
VVIDINYNHAPRGSDRETEGGEPDPEILWSIVTDHLSVLDRTVVALLKES